MHKKQSFRINVRYCCPAEIVASLDFVIVSRNAYFTCDSFIEGGTISNIYALMLARHRKFPNIKEEGMYGGQKMVVYTSAQVRIYNTGNFHCRFSFMEYLFKTICTIYA